MTPHRKRVVVADDHSLILTGIVALLTPEYDVVGQATDGRIAVETARRLLPDVVVLDIGMPGLNGIDASRQIVTDLPETRIVFLTQHLDTHYVAAAFRAGGMAYVAKQSANSELLKAMRTVLARRYYVTPLITDRHPDLAVQDPSVNPAHLLTDRLTNRQREVLQLIAEGMTAKEIAAKLNISTKTAEYHRACIMEELGLHNTATLTRYALSHGIVSD